MPDQQSGDPLRLPATPIDTTFRAELSEVDGETIVRLSGDVDLAVADEVWEHLEKALSTAGRVIIDLSATTFMDSTGLNVMLRAHRENDQIVLRSPSRSVLKILDLTGLGDLLTIEQISAQDDLTTSGIESSSIE